MTVTLHPLTNGQREALTTYLAQETGGNHVLAYALPQSADLARLHEAVNTVLIDLTVLQRGLVQANGMWQFVDDDSKHAHQIHEYALEGADLDGYAELFTALTHHRFRTSDAVFVRISLIRGDENVLVIVAAPFLLDRQSVVQVARAISSEYNGAGLDAFVTIDQTALLAAEQEYLGSESAKIDRTFWRALLGDRSFEWKPPQSGSLHSEFSSKTVIDGQAFARFRALCEDIGVETDMAFIATAHFLLYRLTGNSRVATGFQEQQADRDRMQLGCDERLYLRVGQIDPSWTVREYFRRAARLITYERFHGRTSMKEMIDEARAADATFTRYTNILINGSLHSQGALMLGDDEATVMEHVSDSASGHDIVFAIEETTDGVLLSAAVRDKGDATGVFAGLHRYATLISHNLLDPDQTLESLHLFDPETRAERIEESWGPVLDDVPSALACILEHGRTLADQPALACRSQVVTWSELLKRSGDVARSLQPFVAGHEEPLVGICMSRGVEMVISLLGVLRAGAGYVPLDPANPVDRLQYILGDSGALAVISDEPTREVVTQAVGELPVVYFEDIEHVDASFADSAIDPTSIAYVIYTSGTTGKPKGVVIEHRNLDTFCASWTQVLPAGPGDRWLQFASLNFDASVLEIGNSLTSGATLVVAPSEVRSDPAQVHAYLVDQQITHAFIPPAMLKLLPLEPIGTLRHIIVGGEATSEETAGFWAKIATLWNAYGPTETTVACSAQPLRARKSNDLGRPMPGYAMYLLDESGEPAAIGGIGEIWIAGDAVTRGYLNRPDLTASKFLVDPFRGGRMYATGDLARRLPDRGLEYIGRNDFQVKIRGYRMEIGDIESVIDDVEGVGACVVMPVELAGEKQLVAWYTSASTSPESVRTQIEKVLPYYMVPSHLVRLDAFPINIAGKIDRAQLTLPKVTATGSELSGMAKTVATIWAEALGVPVQGIGLDTHFFHAGGHSLSASMVCSRLSTQLQAQVHPRLLFETPVLAAFVDAIGRTSGEPPLPAIVHDPTCLRAPFRDAIVRSIWTRAIQNGSDNAYTIFLRVEFDGLVSPQLLRAAMIDTLNANPIFSSNIVEESGTLLIQAHEGTTPRVRLLDATEEELAETIERMRTIPFDVTSIPLWQAQIVLVGSRVELLFSVNHIVFDGWSLNLLLEELRARYEALLRETEYERERLTAFDYGVWAAQNLYGERWDASTTYWAEKLAGVSTRTALPSASQAHRPESNKWIELTIDVETTAALRAIAAENEATLSPTLFAVVLMWLWRLSNQKSLTVAYPYAGRDVPGTESIYGMFVKMGFLHAELDSSMTFAELVRSVAAQMIDDRDHFTATPYDVDLSGCGTPNVIFSLQSGVSLEGEINGHAYRAREVPSSTSKAELTAIFYEVASGALEGRMEFDSAILDEAQVLHFARLLRTVAAGAGRDGQARLIDVPYLDDEDVQALARLELGPGLEMTDTTIVDVFRATAQRVPQRIAMRYEDRAFTYADVDAASDRLASRLIAEHHVVADQRVGISLVKSPELIIAVLAILKAGGAYVPLDTSYPAERLAYIIEDSGSALIVADATGREVISSLGIDGVTFVDPVAGAQVGALSFAGPNPYAMAYVIYTSGSTGKPKGVMIEHRSVPRMIRATASLLSFDEDSRIVLMGTINFDASVVQMFLPLLSGGTLVVLPPNLERDPELLFEYLAEQGVTHALMTPSLVRNLPQRALPSMQALAFGGEEIDADSAAYWSRATKLYSLYGPTETTVLCTGGQVLPDANHRILGKPVQGYHVYLLNDDLQQVPPGCIGEIYIGGSGDARGYLGKPELTLERFMVDPFESSPYHMMYRSGDLGRFDAEGNIEFFGRNDSQIKLRGFRIELGEIETAIQGVDGVIDAAADVRGEGQTKYIVGYYTADVPIDEAMLVSGVSHILPEYMLPTFWIAVDAIPRTANGKLDRRALPDPRRKGASDDPPAPGLESQIAEVMESLLGFTGVGRSDDFFKLGGNSLLVARFQSLLHSELGLDVSIAQLYAAPTVAGIGATGGEAAITDAERTVRAGLTFTVDDAIGDYPERIDHVLLTGAKGFLGVYLLAELTQRVGNVTCVLRDVDVESAWKSLLIAAERASLSLDESKIDVVIGDLGSDRLGLDEHTWDRLAGSVDAIVHCGAWVHHLYSYATLKTTNVDSSVDLLELATTRRRKYFTFVSTVGAGEIVSGVEKVTERIENPSEHPPMGENGYLLSKWASEQLAQLAHEEFGISTVIARPGNITGDDRSGYSNFEHNHFWLYVKGCIQLGACPRSAATVELTPVNQLAREIAAVSLDRADGMRVLNLSNPHHVLMSEFIVAAGAQLGVDVAVEDPTIWQARLTDLDPGNGLYAIRDFYLGELEGAGMPVEVTKTQSTLRELGVVDVASYDELRSLYVSYLNSVGFLP